MRRNRVKRHTVRDAMESVAKVLLVLIVIGIVIVLLLETGGSAADEPYAGREESVGAAFSPSDNTGVNYGVHEALRELTEVNRARYETAK